MLIDMELCLVPTAYPLSNLFSTDSNYRQNVMLHMKLQYRGLTGGGRALHSMMNLQKSEDIKVVIGSLWNSLSAKIGSWRKITIYCCDLEPLTVTWGFAKSRETGKLSQYKQTMQTYKMCYVLCMRWPCCVSIVISNSAHMTGNGSEILYYSKSHNN